MTPMLCVIPGDGIGKEVIPAAIMVLQAVVPDLEIVMPKRVGNVFKNTVYQSYPKPSVPSNNAGQLYLERFLRRRVGSKDTLALSSPYARNWTCTPTCARWRSLPKISPQADIDFLIVRENTEGLYVRSRATGRRYSGG